MQAADKPFFPWRAEYSVAIPEIDRQHQVLVRLINDLQQGMYEGRGKAVLSAILAELVCYAEEHFAFEENLLEARGYSNLAGHHEEHTRLTAEVEEIRARFEASRLTMTMEVMRFLKSWLTSHILVHDKAYARELAPETGAAD